MEETLPVVLLCVSLRAFSFMKLNYKIDLVLLKCSCHFFIHCSNFVRPVCLPEPDEDFPVNSNCEISGWGARHWSDCKLRHSKNLFTVITDDVQYSSNEKALDSIDLMIKHRCITVRAVSLHNNTSTVLHAKLCCIQRLNSSLFQVQRMLIAFP